MRRFQGSPEINVEPNLMVLDGQQRLTSLYQALFRKDGVKYKKKLYTFYLDIKTLLKDPDGDILEGEPYFKPALFYVKIDKDGKKSRYLSIDSHYELTTEEDELEASALPLGIIFDVNGALSDWQEKYFTKIIKKDYAEDWSKYPILSAEWNRLVKPWLDRIRQYQFPVVELRKDMPLEAICFIFEKVNSLGVPLDVFDLCTAIFWSKGFKLNEVWSKTKIELESENYEKLAPLEGTFFLQSVSLLESIARKRLSPDVRIGVTCQKRDLMKLDVEKVKELWDWVVKGYKEASAFILNEGIINEKIQPYSTLLIPLSATFAYLYKNSNELKVKAAWPKLRQWFWCSVFSQRYSSQVDSTSALDFEQTLKWIEGNKEPDAVRTFSFRANYLQEIANIRNVMYKGILCLLA